MLVLWGINWVAVRGVGCRGGAAMLELKCTMGVGVGVCVMLEVVLKVSCKEGVLCQMVWVCVLP